MRRCQRVRIKRFMCRTWSHSHCLLSYFFLDDDFFFPEDFFFEVVFFEEDFFLEADFLAGTFAPALRASESPMAIACLRLVTFLPDFSSVSTGCASKRCPGRQKMGKSSLQSSFFAGAIAWNQ